MNWIFAWLRFILRTAWIIPVFWAFKLGAGGWLGPVLPAHLLLIFGLIEIALWVVLPSFLSRSRRLVARTAFAVAMTAASAGFVPLVALATGRTLTIAALALNILLLIVITLLSQGVLSEASYQSILRDLRLGVMGVIFSLTFTIVMIGQRQVHLTAPVYLGVAVYILIGVFALSMARRVAFDEETEDERESDLESDWILTTLMLVSGLALIALVLAQVFAFDVVGSLGVTLLPVQRLLIPVLQDVGLAVANAITWFLGLFHLHVHVKPPHVSPQSPGQTSRHSGHRVGHHPAPPWFDTALKVTGILVIGAVAIGFLGVLSRVAGRFRMSTLQGELRISRWSWRRMFRWTLGRAKTELANLMPRVRSPLHRPRSLRTVRDIYREFLRVGSQRARARNLGETGLEYSRDIGDRWQEAGIPLEELNALYIRERYGAHDSSEEAMAAARRDLQRIREASQPRQARNSQD